MKKVTALLLCVATTLTMLAGCGKGNTTGTSTFAPDSTISADVNVFASVPEAVTPDAKVVATPEMYPNVDFEKHDTVYLYLIGGTPNDFNDILALANDYLTPFNTTLDITIMSWADYQNLYSLNLTSGTNIDAIFTAPWCYLWTEATKGSFMSLSEDFITNCMPLTRRLQGPDTWGGVKLNGNIVALPQNATNPNGKIVAIRQDLAEKYGITELKNWNDYKNFLLTIAEKETPVSGILGLAAQGSNGELWDVYKQQYSLMPAIEDGNVRYYYTYTGELPKFEDIHYAWNEQYFLDFCLEMKELADAGVWSRDALTSNISDDDAFGALASASTAWNTSVFNYIELAEKNEGVRCAAYDITQEKYVIGEAYNNNALAITASTPRPERTAMILDILKNDTYMNRLFRLGIEDVHYSIDSEGYYTELDKATDYPADNLSLTWATKNGEIKQAGADPRKDAITKAEEAKMVAVPTEGFIFDDSPVLFEVQAVNAVIDQYLGTLQLGLFEDPAATIKEMDAQVKAAGFDKIEAELKAQYEVWYNANK